MNQPSHPIPALREVRRLFRVPGSEEHYCETVAQEGSRERVVDQGYLEMGEEVLYVAGEILFEGVEFPALGSSREFLRARALLPDSLVSILHPPYRLRQSWGYSIPLLAAPKRSHPNWNIVT